jgi:ketosteroid isomerase-like protein
VSADHPNPPDPKLERVPERVPGRERENDQPVEGKEIEQFFQRLPGSFHWPKPNAEAVAAAVEAIQRMAGGSAVAHDLATAGAPVEPGFACSACGGLLPADARFCISCGTPQEPAAGDLTAADPAAQRPSRAGAQHHFHHHYHHIVPSSAVSVSGHATASGATSAESDSGAPRGRAPGSAGAGKSPGGRAEAGARQVVQDWAQACNTRHIDDLLELYSADATLIRSSVPPVRSLPAIREFLISLLEAGLGDVEMESLRVEVMGDIALDLGRCKMLVPVAMGKRREERGKYLIVLVRQPAGTWKILADCWSADLAVSAPPPEPVVRKTSEPIPPLRKPR